jgi:hypothetical protein
MSTGRHREQWVDLDLRAGRRRVGADGVRAPPRRRADHPAPPVTGQQARQLPGVCRALDVKRPCQVLGVGGQGVPGRGVPQQDQRRGHQRSRGERAQQPAVPLVAEPLPRLVHGQPVHLVNLVTRREPLGLYAPGGPVADPLQSSGDRVGRFRQRTPEHDPQTRLLSDLADRGVQHMLARFDLSLRKGPVIVPRPMHEHDLGRPWRRPITVDRPAPYDGASSPDRRVAVPVRHDVPGAVPTDHPAR